MARMERANNRSDGAMVGREPGYFGGIPYLLLLRALIALGIWLRFELHGFAYHQSLAFLANVVGLFIALALAIVLHKLSKASWAKQICLSLILVDVMVVSFFYSSTQNVESDF